MPFLGTELEGLVLQLCYTDPSQPSQSLIKSICYPSIFRFSTAATKHGCKHEALAIAAYEKTMKEIHANFFCQQMWDNH